MQFAASRWAVMTRRAVVVSALGLLGWLATGCRTYEQHSRAMRTAYAAGQFPTALQAAKSLGKPGSKDFLLSGLEQATILRANGQIGESSLGFEQAADVLEKYADEAKTKVGREGAALLTNQANLPYRGRAYDAIMLHVYQALNHIQSGDLQAARVDLVRAYEKQKDAVYESQKRIEKAKEEVAAQAEKEQIAKSQQDPTFQASVTSQYAGMDALQVYADYVNPFAVYLDGLFFLSQATDASDLDRARRSLERAASFAPANEAIRKDLEIAAAGVSGAALEPAVYVIFETGRAPCREQIRIDIPILIANVSYVGAAFPRLVFEDDYVPYLKVVSAGGTKTTQLVANLDSVVAHDFKNELPVIITKTVAATVIKAAAGYAVNRAAENAGGDAGMWAARLATAALQATVNIADLRTWTTLPKQLQVCRLPLSPDRSLTLQTANGTGNQQVTVMAGQIILVFAKSTSSASPLFVSQMKLR
jgi:hypothetical protein